MEKGHIKDEDITASSAFDFKSVGPHLARLDQDSDGGAWCPKKTIGKKYKQTSEYVHVKNNSVFHDTPESYEIVEFDNAIGRWEKRFYAISTIRFPKWQLPFLFFLFFAEPGVKEWIQIDLHRPYRITRTATQGRYGGGNGKEYAEEFLLEYWRPSMNEWKTYR